MKKPFSLSFRHSTANLIFATLSIILLVNVMLLYAYDYVKYSTQLQKYDYIQSIIDKSVDDGFSLNAENIDAITEEVKKEYGDDTERLEADLKAIDTITPLTNIFYNQVKDTTLYGISGYNGEDDNNDPFIMAKNADGEFVIWIDNSVNCATTLGKTRDIPTECEGQFNPILAEKAFDNIVRQQSGFKVWSYLPVEESFPWYDEIKNITYIDETVLRDLFFKYNGDIRVFKSLEFLGATSYIYQDKDLLGNLIVTQNGKLNENYQLIMVQGFNILDVINSNQQYKDTVESFDLALEKTSRMFAFYIGFCSLVGFTIFIILAINHNKKESVNLTLCKGCDKK